MVMGTIESVTDEVSGEEEENDAEKRETVQIKNINTFSNTFLYTF